jgi:hypothetical protein
MAASFPLDFVIWQIGYDRILQFCIEQMAVATPPVPHGQLIARWGPAGNDANSRLHDARSIFEKKRVLIQSIEER